MSKFFIIAHDGTMEGDCPLDPMMYAEVPSIAAVNWNSYVKMEPYIRKAIEDNYHGDMDPEDVQSELDECSGWWIVTESTIELMEEVAGCCNCGGDSAVYELQGVLKAIARHLAVAKVDKV